MIYKMWNLFETRIERFKSVRTETEKQANSNITLDVKRLLKVSNWLSKKERRVDALALRADERRDKLR